MEASDLTGTHHLISLKGRYLFTVSSADIYWVTEGKDQVFPLLPSEDLDTDRLTFIIEADGWLAFPRVAEYNSVQVGEFARFEVDFLGFKVAQLA